LHDEKKNDEMQKREKKKQNNKYCICGKRKQACMHELGPEKEGGMEGGREGGRETPLLLLHHYYHPLLPPPHKPKESCHTK